METYEHSQLPWAVGGNGRSVICPVPDIADGYDHFMIGVASSHSLVCAGEAAANAAFIVKACNAHEALVEALEFARNRIEFLGLVCTNSKHFEANHSEFFPKIDAALALAKNAEPGAVVTSADRATVGGEK